MSAEPKPTTGMTQQEYNLARLEAAEGLRPYPDPKDIYQPKPTGEWTVDDLARIGLPDEWLQPIADAHNAALAAEREKVANLSTWNDKYREELAAEREKIKKLEQEIENLHLHISVK